MKYVTIARKRGKEGEGGREEKGERKGRWVSLAQGLGLSPSWWWGLVAEVWGAVTCAHSRVAERGRPLCTMSLFSLIFSSFGAMLLPTFRAGLPQLTQSRNSLKDISEVYLLHDFRSCRFDSINHPRQGAKNCFVLFFFHEEVESIWIRQRKCVSSHKPGEMESPHTECCL